MLKIEATKPTSSKNHTSPIETIPPNSNQIELEQGDKNVVGDETVATNDLTSVITPPNSIPITALKEQTLDRIHQLSNEQLITLSSDLDRVEKVTPDLLYKNEIRDESWAPQKEEEIQFDFYNKLPLNGAGSLDLVDCRTRYCRIVINTVGKTSPIQPQLFAAFNGTVLTPGNFDTENNTSSFEVARVYTRATSKCLISARLEAARFEA